MVNLPNYTLTMEQQMQIIHNSLQTSILRKPVWKHVVWLTAAIRWTDTNLASWKKVMHIPSTGICKHHPCQTALSLCKRHLPVCGRRWQWWQGHFASLNIGKLGVWLHTSWHNSTSSDHHCSQLGWRLWRHSLSATFAIIPESLRHFLVSDCGHPFKHLPSSRKDLSLSSEGSIAQRSQHCPGCTITDMDPLLSCPPQWVIWAGLAPCC